MRTGPSAMWAAAPDGRPDTARPRIPIHTLVFKIKVRSRGGSTWRPPSGVRPWGEREAQQRGPRHCSSALALWPGTGPSSLSTRVRFPPCGQYAHTDHFQPCPLHQAYDEKTCHVTHYYLGCPSRDLGRVRGWTVRSRWGAGMRPPTPLAGTVPVSWSTVPVFQGDREDKGTSTPWIRCVSRSVQKHLN